MSTFLTLNKTKQKLYIGDHVRCSLVCNQPTGIWQTYFEGYISKIEGPTAIIEQHDIITFIENNIDYNEVRSIPHFGKIEISCNTENQIVIINNKHKITNYMNTFKNTIKNLMRTEPEKTFVEVGFLDQEENITTKGREALEYILWEKNKDELKKLADQIVSKDSDR